VGSQTVCRSSLRESSLDMSAEEISKSKTSLFSLILSGWVGRLWDDDEPVLQAPPDHDLSGALGVPSGDVEDHGVVELVPAGQGAVGLELYPLAVAEAEQLLLVEERVELHLVDGGRDIRAAQQLLQVPDGVVAHAYGPARAPPLELHERLPGLDFRIFFVSWGFV